VNVQDLSFTKYIDASSASLLQCVCTGKHIKEATLVVRKAGEKPLEYITISMTEVFVTSLSKGGSGGEDRLTENVTLNFAAFKYKYLEQTKDGTDGKKGEFNFNIAENNKE